MLINLRNALMSGRRTPTAKDYVQNGLVAMWDGIENAGWGVHDPNATVWKDLSDSGNDFVFAGPYLTQNGVSVYRNSAVATMPTGIVTVELSLSEASGIRFLDIGNGCVIANRCSSTKVGFQFKDQVGCYINGDGLNSAVSFDYSSNKSYVNGAIVQSYSGWTNWPSMNAGSLSQNWKDSGYIFIGKVRFIRFYNRALTADEVAANYAVDVARFGLPTT